jgi:hypothetical protein
MKKAFLLLAAIVFLLSCSKRAVPQSSSSSGTIARADRPVSAPIINKPVTETPVEPTPVAPPPAAAIFTSPLIVIDEAGKVITSRENLPDDIAEKVDYKKISHAFTPVQRQNLITRFKMVPPRVLFVPENLASKSGKGSYVVFKKKFWYWKKDDGLYHLDETYYE